MEVRHPHVPELQSIRGLAATLVLLHHSSFLFLTSPLFHYYAELLINAHAAVMIFFVLSGYVLVRSLNHQAITIQTSAKFYVARLFRIFPALWVVCAFAATYLLLIHFTIPTQMASPWYLRDFQKPPTIMDIAASMAALRFALVPPAWSVHVELFASALIPIICLLLRRSVGLLWLVFGMAIAVSVFEATSHSGGTGIIYIPSFILGALAVKYQGRLGPSLFKPAAIIVSATVLLFFRRINPAWRFEVDYNAFIPILFESVAAAFLIIGIAKRPVSLLRHRVLIRLGDISYSLYLIHFIVMSLLAKLLFRFTIDQDVRAVLLMLGTLAVTWPIATLSYNYVEKPGIALGRAIWGGIKLTKTTRCH